MQQQGNTSASHDATAKCADRPQRIEGDPEGYEPIFYDGDAHDPCSACALRHKSACIAAPCNFFSRPERKTICYRKEEAK